MRARLSPTTRRTNVYTPSHRNKHRTKLVWYPSKRFFIMPIENAKALADALSAAAAAGIVHSLGIKELRKCDDSADCEDDVECTIDTCDEDTHTCMYTPDDSLCDNGLYCDGNETCHPIEGCQAHIAPCAVQDLWCDETHDRCVECLIDAHCDDGDPCTEDPCNVDGSCVQVPVCGACCLSDGVCQQMTEDTCTAVAGNHFKGVGSPCLGDEDDSGYDDACEIPSVSAWGLAILALLFLTGGKLFARQDVRKRSAM